MRTRIYQYKTTCLLIVLVILTVLSVTAVFFAMSSIVCGIEVLNQASEPYVMVHPIGNSNTVYFFGDTVTIYTTSQISFVVEHLVFGSFGLTLSGLAFGFLLGRRARS